MGLNINREYVLAGFKEYTEKYDITMLKIKLKVEHTYRVSLLCDRISESLGLSAEDTDLAWLIGMTHDIARFEQVRIYDSFNDSETVDHAQFGADLLFKEGLLDYFFEDKVLGVADFAGDVRIIETAIRNHNKFRIDSGLDDREEMFCNIIRDADKIDIIKANTDFPLWEIYNVTRQELENAPITKEVYEAFKAGQTVLRSLKKSPADNIVSHASFIFELVYSESRRILKQLGYIEKFLDFKSSNPETCAIIDEMKLTAERVLEDEAL